MQNDVTPSHHHADQPTPVTHPGIEQPSAPSVIGLPTHTSSSNTNKPSSLKSGHRFWPPRWPRLSKKQWWLVAAIASVCIAAGVLAFFLWWQPKAAVAPAKPKTKPAAVKPVPQVIYSKLTGLPITDASLNSLPVTAVMVENSTDARPQSGIDQAGVVFEAIAEGGITRFLTLYQDTDPAYIGPIRSVRPYYLQWLQGFDAPVAHVGGSPEALADIKAWGIQDLDQFYNGNYYHRISSRYAPHNVYTSMDELHALEKAKGITTSNYTGFPRKPEAASKAPNATSIDFAISGFYYNVHYDYDAVGNAYKRSEAGQPHMVVDAQGQTTQLEPKVVIGLVMSQGIEADDLHTSYNTIGSGAADIFQDGIVTPVTWHKDSNTAQFTFTDAAGKPVALNPGQTWLTVLGSANYITYK